MARALVVVVAVALVCGCAAATVQEESTLHVDLPPELTGNYVHSEALFGRPSYGGTVAGGTRVALGEHHTVFSRV